MSLQDQIKSAVGSHGLWKARLKAAIDTASSEFSPGVVRKDDQCEFGKWIHSTTDPALKNSRELLRCKDLHREFHQAAAQVLDLALAGHKEAAKQAMSPSSAFAKASGALTIAMGDWSRAAHG